MTTFYFIRHGQTDISESGTKIYQNWGFNMCPLTEKGVQQIRQAALDSRLHDAQLIIASPYGRTMHTAAILSKELQLDIKVETDLHEWCASKNYEYIPDDTADRYYKELQQNHGNWPDGTECEWENADIIRKRISDVLQKYTSYQKVIVVCHGTAMQYFLNIEHPDNGQIVEWKMQPKHC